ncbi:50S ribosomal protein L6 [Candidatus Woesearchaeota archaeon]|nr:50S ribosomal protein L6 [Candidatus Woesearchaeota archaeon]
MAKEKKEIKAEIEIPEGIKAEVAGPLVKVQGKAGEASKKLFNPRISISKEGNKIVLKALRSTKREQKLVNTFRAHIKNMLKGANESYDYRLKICSGHFPMNVSVKGDELIIKNFFGEKIPRILKIKEGADVKVEGDIIIVRSPDKELASQVAADIEQKVQRTKYDRRIFQDGCYITSKGEKTIE